MSDIFRTYKHRDTVDDVIEQAHPANNVYPWIPNLRNEPPGERGKNWSTERNRNKPQVGRIINRNPFGHGQLFEIENMI